MRGALFETLMVSELMKTAFNQAKPNDLHFWRDHRGEEIDVVIERNGALQAMEFKSGATVASDWFKPIKRWSIAPPRRPSWCTAGRQPSGGRMCRCCLGMRR